MKLLGTLLVLTLAAGGQASKPNFSGEWKMNAAKSNFGQLPAPTSVTRSITHAEPAISIVEEQVSEAMGDQKATRKYVTDGSETTFETNGALVRSTAVWKDNTLVFNSTVDVVGLTFNDVMSLSADGKTLTSAVQIATPQGEVNITLVFDRQ